MGDDEPEAVVKYMVACARTTHPSDSSHEEYTLHEVRYYFDIPANREWPVQLDRLWLFVRFYTEAEALSLTLALDWLDAPGGEVGVGYFDWQVAFNPADLVHDRVWNVSTMRYPGQGQYRFRLTDDATGDILADEYIFIRSSNEARAE